MGLLSKLRGGATADVTAEEATRLLRDGALLVDVRERAEWEAGHAPRAKHHPLGRLHASMPSLPDHRTLVVVCRSGNRSGRATRMLRKAGFDAVNLRGGMHAWQAAGGGVVSTRGGRGRVA